MIRIWRRLASLGYIVLLRNDLIAKRKSGNALDRHCSVIATQFICLFKSDVALFVFF